jgi:deoxyribose-phosphate aldolase
MNLANYIDHTILKPDTNTEDIRQLCEEAIAHQFAAVCVPPYFVKNAYQLLEDSPVKVATVIGFPMGYSATFAKVEEIKRAIDEGAHELDVVINLCAVKSRNWNYVQNDIASMTTATHLKARKIKVILETGLLTEEEIRRMAAICREVEPDFVKTSTGFSGGGATLQVVEMLQEELNGTPIKIKASGGIRSAEDARAMIEAGAERLGSSSGVRIVGNA